MEKTALQTRAAFRKATRLKRREEELLRRGEELLSGKEESPEKGLAKTQHLQEDSNFTGASASTSRSDASVLNEEAARPPPPRRENSRPCSAKSAFWREWEETLRTLCVVLGVVVG